VIWVLLTEVVERGRKGGRDRVKGVWSSPEVRKRRKRPRQWMVRKAKMAGGGMARCKSMHV
jgi:hypothetical protein